MTKPILGILFLVGGIFLMVFFWNHLRSYQEGRNALPISYEVTAEMKESGARELIGKRFDNGKMFSLGELKGTPVLVSFWASWCGPCVEEFPSLINMLNHFKGQIKMVAVSADSDEEALKQFLEKFNGYHKDVVHIWDKTLSIATSYGTEVLPESYLFQADHKLVRKFSGAERWDRPEMLSYLSSNIE